MHKDKKNYFIYILLFNLKFYKSDQILFIWTN